MSTSLIEVRTLKQLYAVDVGALLSRQFDLEASQKVTPIRESDHPRLRTLVQLFKGVSLATCTPEKVEDLFNDRRFGKVNPSKRVDRSLATEGTKIMTKQDRYRARKRGLPVDDVPRTGMISEATIYKEHRLFKAVVLRVAQVIVAPALLSVLLEMDAFKSQRLGKNRSDAKFKVEVTEEMLSTLGKNMPTQEMTLLFALTLSNLWNVKQILALTWADVDLANSSAQVPIRVDQTLNGEKREVALHPKTVTLLRGWKAATSANAGPSDKVLSISAGVVTAAFRRTADRLGMTRVNLNHVRHAAYLRYLRQGLKRKDLNYMSGVKE